MRKLSDVTEKMDEILRSRWSFLRDEKLLMENIAGLGLLAQLVKRDLYFTIPLTIIDPNDGVNIKLSPEQINEYLDTGDVARYPLHVISNWIVGRLNLDKMIIRMFQTPFCTAERSPSENYEIAAQRIKEFQSEPGMDEGEELMIDVEVAKVDDDSKKVWTDLARTAQFFHDNGVTDDERIGVARMRFFGDFLAQGKDDEWEETDQMQRIPVPQPSQYTPVKLDQKTVNAIEGNSFGSLYFSHEVELKGDRNHALNYLWSALEWSERKVGVKFTEVVRVSTSNKWPVEWPDGSKSPSIENKNPDYELPEAMERYVFRVGKVNWIPVFELECWENGHVYLIKNHDDEGPVYFKRFHDGRAG